jgi:hypothetical protein
MVALSETPPALLEGLPAEDQRAVVHAVGKPIRVAGCDEDGRAELQFTDSAGLIHYTYVSPSLISQTA